MKRFVMLGVAALAVAAFVTCSSEESATNGGGGEGAVHFGGGSAGWQQGGGNPQGGCGANCVAQGTGVGTDTPFDPATHDSSGVGTDPDGALVLDQSQTGIPSIIWIANTGAGTVTKIDTTTAAVLGQYSIGGSDPSRTSVNSLGDVFVGDRAGGRLIKISSAGPGCPDTNGDGQITTSAGLGDILPWGQDDCMLWAVPVPDPPMVRGVAAQDVEVADPQPDDPHHTIINHYVWTGGTNHRTAYKYAGDDGTLLIQTPSPTTIYGLALDGRGQLWMSGNVDPDGPSLGRIDTTKCVDQATCDAAEICYTTCDLSGNCVCTQCSGSCDDATKERITVPNGVYGITVDYKQRVWLGGTNIKRYNPLAPAAQRYAEVPASVFIHGITADAKGWVWGADGGTNVVRVNGDTLDWLTIAGVPSKGMAVDKDGKIWSASYYDGASYITPGPSNTISDYTTQVPAGPQTGANLGFCYTYSDMTGQQLALAANDPGFYRQVFDGCDSGATTWINLYWTVETPPNTSVKFSVRTADTEAGLAAATWYVAAHIPADTSPASLADALQGVQMMRFLEVEVQLQGAVGLDGLVSPRVLNFGVTHTCNDQPT